MKRSQLDKVPAGRFQVQERMLENLTGARDALSQSVLPKTR